MLQFILHNAHLWYSSIAVLYLLIISPSRQSKGYGHKTFDSAMKDTLAMERLQHSDYVLTIHGNCGSSQMIEAASHGTLYDQMVLAKNTEAAENEVDGLMNHPETNLRISYHLARSLADVHGIDGPNVVSFTHNDIDCEQFIFVGGVFK